MAAFRTLQRDGAGSVTSPLSPIENFGSNPGALTGSLFLPHHVAQDIPLVVVLHGCTQSAAGHDHGAGWTQLATELGFAVLLPEQTRSNNFNLCFNWYEPADSARDAGEPLSIRQMIAAVVDHHSIDPSRIFITGLSAGGAMTSVMLATYPEIFAGGAIVAGLPYGSASNLPQAFDRMRGHGFPSPSNLAGLVETASAHRGPWPTISVWHGGADAIVDASNGDMIVEQWRPLHGVSAKPNRIDVIDGCRHRVWCDANGRDVVEDYRIANMGHGTPVATMGAEPCGTSGAYALETGISSTRRIAQFWGLGKPALSALSGLDRKADLPACQPRYVSPGSTGRNSAAVSTGVEKIIEDALRAAGLMS